MVQEPQRKDILVPIWSDLEKKGRKERTSSQSASKKINIFQPSSQECYECGYVTSTVEILKIHRAEEHYDLHD